MEPADLYGLPLDRFVPERGALAKALRADKRRDEAAEVAALRKPSVAAWAVNQLVRTQGSAIGELYAAGDALRSAQADLLAGTGNGRALRAAINRERAAVDVLVERARGLLSSEGLKLSPTVVERVADTLHAAALGEGAREQVRNGRLQRDLRHVGLGLGESPAPAPAPAPRPAKAASGAAELPKPVSKGKDTTAQRAVERERLAAERAEQQRLRDEARKSARAAESAARRHAERAARALHTAAERRERAAQALAEADDALAVAREQARAADEEHDRTQADLDAT